jgi:hypothetical protein
VEIQKKKKKKGWGKKKGMRYFVEYQKERKIEESQEACC